MVTELAKELRRFDPRLGAKKYGKNSIQIVFDDQPVAKLIKDKFDMKLIFYPSFVFVGNQGMSALNGVNRAVSRIISKDHWDKKVKFRHGSYLY